MANGPGPNPPITNRSNAIRTAPPVNARVNQNPVGPAIPRLNPNTYTVAQPNQEVAYYYSADGKIYTVDPQKTSWSREMEAVYGKDWGRQAVGNAFIEGGKLAFNVFLKVPKNITAGEAFVYNSFVTIPTKTGIDVVGAAIKGEEIGGQTLAYSAVKNVANPFNYKMSGTVNGTGFAAMIGNTSTVLNKDLSKAINPRVLNTQFTLFRGSSFQSPSFEAGSLSAINPAAQLGTGFGKVSAKAIVGKPDRGHAKEYTYDEDSWLTQMALSDLGGDADAFIEDLESYDRLVDGGMPEHQAKLVVQDAMKNRNFVQWTSMVGRNVQKNIDNRKGLFGSAYDNQRFLLYENLDVAFNLWKRAGANLLEGDFSDAASTALQAWATSQKANFLLSTTTVTAAGYLFVEQPLGFVVGKATQWYAAGVDLGTAAVNTVERVAVKVTDNVTKKVNRAKEAVTSTINQISRAMGPAQAIDVPYSGVDNTYLARPIRIVDIQPGTVAQTPARGNGQGNGTWKATQSTQALPGANQKTSTRDFRAQNANARQNANTNWGNRGIFNTPAPNVRDIRQSANALPGRR